jgi:hypothetical protein
MNQLDVQIAEEQRKNKTEDSFVLWIKGYKIFLIALFVILIFVLYRLT